MTRMQVIVAVSAIGLMTGSASAVPTRVDPTSPAAPAHRDRSEPFSVRASNITAADTPSDIAPALPSPGLPRGAMPHDFLVAARKSLAAGHTGEAQRALEMAETRLLDRSVRPGNAGTPDDDAIVGVIADARHDLGNGQFNQARQDIDRALLE